MAAAPFRHDGHADLPPHQGPTAVCSAGARLIAGLGNVYSDEILFQSDLDPEAQTGELLKGTIGTLHRALQRVLEKAIEARADPDEMPRSWLLPRRKDGADCPRCAGTIRRRQVAGRSSYWCPSHQRARK